MSGVIGSGYMTHAPLIFNLLMLVVDVAVLGLLRWRTHIWTWLAGLGCAVGVALGLAVLLGSERFGIALLAADGLFLHGVCLCVGSAILLERTRPKAAILSGAIAAVLLAVAVDAFWIEPTWLEVSHVRIHSPKITHPVRVVVVADLQMGRLGHYEQGVLKRALAEKPDLILLAGDYVQTSDEKYKKVCGKVNRFLKELDFRAPDGVFAVRGNIDPPCWPAIFQDLPVVTVQQTSRFEAAGIVITCLDVYESRLHHLRIASPDPDRFHVVLGHKPDFALGEIEADLLVAGHTHGGQVRLPWIGPLAYPSAVPRSWAAGLSELPSGAKLLVSRGLGLERQYAPRIRFLCRPEIVVIDLVPSGKTQQE